MDVERCESLRWGPLAALATLHVAALGVFPFVWTYGLSASEVAFHIAAYFLGGFGITALYHRAWAHNAVKFSEWVEYVLAVSAALVLQKSAKDWIRHHVLHHDHTDTTLDPYNIQRGFWWAHIEWIVFTRPESNELPARLRANRVIEWQDRWFWVLFGLLNFVIPAAISVLVGMPWYSGILLSALRLVVTSHVVYSVNSVCHKWGTRKYSAKVSARDVWWFPFALGEQYHNFHHAFPRDYRHGMGRFDFDPTKWLIWIMARMGWAENLFTTPASRIAVAMDEAKGEFSGNSNGKATGR